MVEGKGAGPHLVRFWRMRGTMLAGGPALARNGCFNSSAAVARWAGSRTSRRSRKPFRDGDTCRGGAEGQGVRASLMGGRSFCAVGPQFPPLPSRLAACTVQEGSRQRSWVSRAWGVDGTGTGTVMVPVMALTVWPQRKRQTLGAHVLPISMA